MTDNAHAYRSSRDFHAALGALGALGFRDAIPGVLPLLKDPKEELRIAAIETLADLHKKN